MINITLPDGAVRQYEKGTTALDIAKSISEGLARKILAADVNGQVWDISRPIHTMPPLNCLTGRIRMAKIPSGIPLHT